MKENCRGKLKIDLTCHTAHNSLPISALFYLVIYFVFPQKQENPDPSYHVTQATRHQEHKCV